jgi:hypothetical protein
MDMILHERPGITGSFGFIQKASQAGEKIFIIPPASEERQTLYSPQDDMMEETRSVYTTLSRHA